MDKTEQFIKMSDCLEIFNECKFQGGDWFHTDGKSWMVYEFNEEVPLEEHRKHFEGIVFLPRQDDIQKMMGIETALGFGDAIDDMLYERDEGGIYDTMAEWVDVHDKQKTPEQLWLAFYMHKKHSKTWSPKEEKWVKKRKN